MQMSDSQETQNERPLERWEYAYVAGVTDFGSNLTVSIQKANDRKFNYAITPKLIVQNEHRGGIAFLEEFCKEHDFYPRIRENENNYRFEISSRENLRKFLKLIYPYLISRHEPVEILLNDLIPGLERGETKTKRDFVRLVEQADRIRELTSSRGKPKYDREYFEDQWNL